jgi:hypothetical protein
MKSEPGFSRFRDCHDFVFNQENLVNHGSDMLTQTEFRQPNNTRKHRMERENQP